MRLSSTTTVSMMASVSYIQRVSNPAITAPIIGATQKSQSWPIYSPPANNAGPVLRAGLTEVLVTGLVSRWIKVRPRPIGIPANPAARSLGRGPDDDEEKKELHHHFVEKPTPQAIFAGAEVAVTVC